MDVYLGEASFHPRWVILALCTVGGGTNRCYDTYRNSHVQRPTLWISASPLSQINGAVMSTSTRLYLTLALTLSVVWWHFWQMQLWWSFSLIFSPQSNQCKFSLNFLKPLCRLFSARLLLSAFLHHSRPQRLISVFYLLYVFECLPKTLIMQCNQ